MTFLGWSLIIFSSITIFYVIKSFITNLKYELNRKKTFLETESDRYFFKRNEVNDSWHSYGRVYTKGIALITNKKTGKSKFIKQAELSDIGILS
jgi:hypothetical protein